jgi:hypothetical protein
MELIKLHHEMLLAGHPGCWKTLELISCNYWWLGVSVDVKKYVLGCNTCQRNKSHNKAPYRLLQPNKVLSEPQEIITMDLIVQLPEATDFDGTPCTAIQVVVERLTKRACFFPCNNTVTVLQLWGDCATKQTNVNNPTY